MTTQGPEWSVRGWESLSYTVELLYFTVQWYSTNNNKQLKYLIYLYEWWKKYNTVW